MARTYPKHLPVDGRGYMQCARSGMLRKPCDMIRDDDGLMVAKDYADFTPGFGTEHPQDRNQAVTGGDPSPIDDATGVASPLDKDELQISDDEIRAAIRENRPPRQGF